MLMCWCLLPKIGYSATAKTWYLFLPQSPLFAMVWWTMSQSCTSALCTISVLS